MYYRADVRSSEAVRYMAATATGAYTMVYTKPTRLRWVHYALHRLLQIAGDTGAALIYSDHFKLVDGVETQSPVIDYQAGSLRDDFDFGSVMVFRTDALREAVAGMDADYRFAGLYDLRLRVSRLGPVVHVNEFLYYDIELDSRRFGEKLFDYVNPRNREVQIEMEAA